MRAYGQHAAVRETAGEILTYQGAPIEAYYHSTCSGRTVPIHEAWPGEECGAKFDASDE